MGGAAAVALLIFKNDGYRALTIPITVIAYLMIRGEPTWMIALGVAQLLILISKIGPHHLAGSRMLDVDKAPTS